MAEKTYDFALTNLDRIKTRLSISTTGFDTFLSRLINSATDYIESSCNRRFKTANYVDVYSIYGNTNYLLLKQTPVTALTKVEWRAGLPNDPQWTEYLASDYQLLEDGKSGIIEFSGKIYTGGNMVRVTYVAGYLYDFANAGDTTKHTLPADLTDVCERMIVKWFKKREKEGLSTEAFDGGTITWQKDIDQDMKDIIAGYKRLPLFV